MSTFGCSKALGSIHPFFISVQLGDSGQTFKKVTKFLEAQLNFFRIRHEWTIQVLWYLVQCSYLYFMGELSRSGHTKGKIYIGAFCVSRVISIDKSVNTHVHKIF